MRPIRCTCCNATGTSTMLNCCVLAQSSYLTDSTEESQRSCGGRPPAAQDRPRIPRERAAGDFARPATSRIAWQTAIQFSHLRLNPRKHVVRHRADESIGQINVHVPWQREQKLNHNLVLWAIAMEFRRWKRRCWRACRPRSAPGTNRSPSPASGREIEKRGHFHSRGLGPAALSEVERKHHVRGGGQRLGERSSEFHTQQVVYRL